MEHVRVTEVHSKRDLKAFVHFPLRLYAKCPYYVPPLNADEYLTFSRDRNPAFETADVQLFLAWRGKEIVGRVAAILSHSANEKFRSRNIRFGWFDSVNDYEVAEALFNAVEEWGAHRGMETLTGPQGFSEFDKAGMLVEGYDFLPTMATYYNYPYYMNLLTRYGFVKDVDYIEYVVRDIHEGGFPPRLMALAEEIRKRRHYQILAFRDRKEMLRYSDRIFDLMEETYSELYGVTSLTPRQRAFSLKKFFPYLNPDLVKVVENREGELIGFFIGIPSLSVALRRARGRLFPLGFLHLWRALRGNSKTIDFCLAGVRKRYRGKGVDLVMGADMFQTAVRLGFEQGESNPELETNFMVRAEWRVVDHELRRRRRVLKKVIGQAGVLPAGVESIRRAV